jgi:tRNA pseudouridine38-40 synthase
MQRYKVKVEYLGTGYCGVQRQQKEKNRSIQSTIEYNLNLLTQENVNVEFCGRTDAGVHALGQYLHFDLEREMNETNILRGMNYYLQRNNEDISFLLVEKVNQNFHARFSCTERIYVYKIINRESFSPVLKNLALHIPQKINCQLMQEAANLITGCKLDFSSFRNSNCQAKTPYRTINYIKIEQKIAQNEIFIYISARSFLYNMVRNIVGTLVDIGKGKYNPKYILEIIEKKDRKFAGKNVSPSGLYFYDAKYD